MKRTVPAWFGSKKTAAILIVLLAGLVGLLIYLWTAYGYRENRYESSSYAMGTLVHQTVYGDGREETAAEAASSVTALENQISWRVESSDIARLNDAAGTEWISLEPETISLLSLCLDVAEKSGGAFDPTILPVSRLWDFDGESPAVPEADRIQTYLSYVNYKNLRINEEDNTASLRNYYMAVDLGAAGKGAGCDAVLDVYKASSLSAGIVAVGGSVGMYGTKPDGSLWSIAVRNPYSDEDGESTMGTLELSGGFVSTSGSYEKNFTQDGVTYHHLLDPKTGTSVENDLVSVTVVCSNGENQGALSDLLSTACFVLGEEEGRELLKEYSAEGIFIRKDRSVFVTEGLRDSFQIVLEGYSYAE